MKAGTILGLAWNNMRRRKLRTGLTALGVVVGIMAVVGISSLAAGFQAQIYAQLSTGLDADIITVSSWGGYPGSGPPSGGTIDLTEADADYIETITGVEVALCVYQTSATVYTEEGDAVQTMLNGVDFTKFDQIYGDSVTFTSGTWPNSSDNSSCVLGYFAETIASVGENATVGVRIGMATENVTFTVRGMLDELGQMGMTTIDGSIFINDTAYRSLLNPDSVSTIIVQVSDPNLAEGIAEIISDYFDGQASVMVPSMMIETMLSVFDSVENFLLLIAMMALLVAGISILNIMLVSVMERTREIGILKALGAKGRTILAQFLGEATILGLVGGILGIFFGWGLGYLLIQILPFGMMFGGRTATTTLLPVITWDTILTALVFAVVVSVVFALYPARKAARLDPVKALRYE